MNTANFVFRPLAALAVALSLVTPRDAAAVDLDTVLMPIHQVGTTAGVSLGHTAIGHTNYNKLVVSGTYTAACNSTVTLPTSGQRSLSREEIVGNFGLITTIPAYLPAIVDMPGFQFLPAGSRIGCTYSWTSRASESSYTVGVPGFSIPTGGGERAQGGTYPFIMVVPAGSREDEGCA